MLLEIVREERPGIVILHLAGALHAPCGQEFQDQLMPLAGGERRIILDCTALTYISSVGARVILEASRKHKPLQGAIIACGLRPELREFMSISGLDSVLCIEEDLARALASSSPS